jgi:dTDP-4-dehydrorhamnose reductase
MRVLVTGASGQLGSVIVENFRDATVIPHTHASLDISDPVAIERTVKAAAPDVIINCAAFNHVDAAEDRPVEALTVNALAVRSLGRAAEASGAILVHYGSDFVFDGIATQPYTEDVRPAPQSSYAVSKLLGEWFALDAPRAYVLRVESLFGAMREWGGRRGSLDTIVDGLERGGEVRVFTDRVVSPSYTGDIAAATRHLISSGAPYGLYHCANAGHATWCELACEAARLLDVQPRLMTMSVRNVKMRAERPQYCALDGAKLAAAGFAMPTWQDALRRWLSARGTIQAVR